MEYIAAKYPKKSSNFTSSSLNKKKLCFTQKITYHPISKTKVSQVLTSCLVESRLWSSINSVIIDFGITDDFFNNWDLFSIYIEHKYQFETEKGEKISAHNYGNINLKMSDHQDNTNILTVINLT